MSPAYIGKNDALKQFATGFFSPKRRGNPGFFIIPKSRDFPHF
jgi:hypothetical protein